MSGERRDGTDVTYRFMVATGFRDTQEDYSPGDMPEINERFVNEFYHWALRQPGVSDEGRAYLQRMAALTDALRQKN